MDHITNNTSLIVPCDVIPVGAQNPRFPVVGHRAPMLYPTSVVMIYPIVIITTAPTKKKISMVKEYMSRKFLNSVLQVSRSFLRV